MGETGNYDLVLFTRDALNENDVCVKNDWNSDIGECGSGSSLVKNSDGSQVIEGLKTAANKHYANDQILEYTKSTDDWMTELAQGANGAWPPSDQFDTEKQFGSQTLYQVLQGRGFSPLNTHLDV